MHILTVRRPTSMATRYSIYLLYWYKFTNTDAWRLGTHLTCCTGTKVQNTDAKGAARCEWLCFGLTNSERRYSVY